MNRGHCLLTPLHRAVYKTTSKLGTPLYRGQAAGPSGVSYREFPPAQAGITKGDTPVYSAGTGQLPSTNRTVSLHLWGHDLCRLSTIVVSAIERCHCIHNSPTASTPVFIIFASFGVEVSQMHFTHTTSLQLHYPPSLFIQYCSLGITGIFLA